MVSSALSPLNMGGRRVLEGQLSMYTEEEKGDNIVRGGSSLRSRTGWKRHNHLGDDSKLHGVVSYVLNRERGKEGNRKKIEMQRGIGEGSCGRDMVFCPVKLRASQGVRAGDEEAEYKVRGTEGEKCVEGREIVLSYELPGCGVGWVRKKRDKKEDENVSRTGNRCEPRPFLTPMGGKPM